MLRFERVRFMFGNLENIQVPVDAFTKLRVVDGNYNALSGNVYARWIEIDVKKDGFIYDRSFSTLFNDQDKLYSRLTELNDIVSIDIIKGFGGTVVSIVAPWDEVSPWENMYQKTYETDDMIKIVIVDRDYYSNIGESGDDVW